MKTWKAKMTNTQETTPKILCEECLRRPVCGNYRATGGVKSCPYFYNETVHEAVWLVHPDESYRTCGHCGMIYEVAKMPHRWARRFCMNCGTRMLPEEVSI